MNNSQPDFNSDFALHYDSFIRLAVPAYDQLFSMADSFFYQPKKTSSNLLVVGAGGGAELLYFSQLYPSWFLTGVDPAEQMLKIALHKIQQAGTEQRVKLHQGFVHELPADNKFDMATCILVFQFLPDDNAKLNLLKSVAERLEHGAPFILVSIYGDKDSTEFNKNFTAWKERFRSNGVNPEESEDVQRILKMPLISEERIKELLDEAGFRNIVKFYSAYQVGGWAAELK
ncbi:MAG: class I SAM-dependent methyltransferase [Planococcus donghaensis]